MDKARLHSIETMGLVDGPGIRTIFFLQGCPLRCLFCHNPDSQAMYGEKIITIEEVLKIAKRYKAYYGKLGGVTFSGGEPLTQSEFVRDAFKELKKEGITTCLDTSGFGNPKLLPGVLENADTVLLDVKSFDDAGFKAMTGLSMKPWHTFAEISKESFHGKFWIRHVMVPGFTDNLESMDKLVKTIIPLIDKIERLEILPYHTMGVDKYKLLNMEYKLKGVPPMNKERAKELEAYARELLEKERQKRGVTVEIV